MNEEDMEDLAGLESSVSRRVLQPMREPKSK
jgi:hypothetical protein